MRTFKGSIFISVISNRLTELVLEITEMGRLQDISIFPNS